MEKNPLRLWGLFGKCLIQNKEVKIMTTKSSWPD